MTLTYRGVSYDVAVSHDANPEFSVSEFTRPVVDLKYRGVSYRLSEVAKTERLGAIFKYRGAEYSTQTGDRGIPATPASSVSGSTSGIENRARILTMNHTRSIRNRLQSMLTRSEMEVGCA